MGVKLMDLPDGVTLVAIARNADEPDELSDTTTQE
jgi:DNA gyrase subunit A